MRFQISRRLHLDRARATAALACLLCLFGPLRSEVRAQIGAELPPPRGTEPLGTPPPAKPTEVVETKPWSLRFNVNEMFEDNVQLSEGGGGDLGSRFDVDLSRQVTVRDQGFSFSANA